MKSFTRMDGWQFQAPFLHLAPFQLWHLNFLCVHLTEADWIHLFLESHIKFFSFHLCVNCFSLLYTALIRLASISRQIGAEWSYNNRMLIADSFTVLLNRSSEMFRWVQLTSIYLGTPSSSHDSLEEGNLSNRLTPGGDSWYINNSELGTCGIF